MLPYPHFLFRQKVPKNRSDDVSACCVRPNAGFGAPDAGLQANRPLRRTLLVHTPSDGSDIRSDAMKPLTRQLSFFIRNNA